MDIKENTNDAPIQMVIALSLIRSTSGMNISTRTSASNEATNERHRSSKNTSLVLRYLLTYFTSVLLSLMSDSLYYFQRRRRHIGGGDGKVAGQFHKDSAGFAYSYYFSFDSLERAFSDLDALAFAEFVADLGEVDEALVEGGSDCYEVLHGFGRNSQRSFFGAVPVVVDRAGFSEAVDVGVERLAGSEGEDKAADGWDELLLAFPA